MLNLISWARHNESPKFEPGLTWEMISEMSCNQSKDKKYFTPFALSLSYHLKLPSWWPTCTLHITTLSWWTWQINALCESARNFTVPDILLQPQSFVVTVFSGVFTFWTLQYSLFKGSILRFHCFLYVASRSTHYVTGGETKHVFA